MTKDLLSERGDEGSPPAALKWKKQPEVGDGGGGMERYFSVFYQKYAFLNNFSFVVQTFSL